MELSEQAECDFGEPPLQKLLALEREKRVSAEIAVEREHQAFLQLRSILLKQRQHSNASTGNTVDTMTTDNASSLKIPSTAATTANQQLGGGDDDDDERKSLRRIDSTSSVGNLSRAFSQEFTTSVLGSLSSPVMSSLDMQTLEVMDSVNSSPSNGTPLSNALAAIGCLDDGRLLKVLSESGADNLIEEHGVVLLDATVNKGAAGCMRILLQSGCDPNLRTPQHPCPILQVAKNGDLRVLNVLIDHHADINVVDRLGYCPLYLALQGGRREIVETILSAEPKMDIMTGFDNSVIHGAVLHDNHNLLRLVIVKLRASYDHETVCRVLNKRNEDGYTPLHQAAAEGYTHCVEILCACPEVDVTLTDFKGRSPFDMASQDCLILLENKTHKEVPIVMETSETDQPKLIVGVVRVMPHHSWSDLLILVKEGLNDFRNVLRGDVGMGVMGDRRSPTYPINTTQAKIPTELRHAIQTPSDVLFDELKSTMDKRIMTLSNFNLKLSRMKASLIGKYSLGKEAELERCQMEEKEDPSATDKQRKKKSPYQIIEFIENIGEPIDIQVDLLGKTSDLAVSSLIPHTLLEEYMQMTSRHKMIMIHGPPETDLSFLTYILTECVRISCTKPLDEVRIHLHPKFTRDDLICVLFDNGLLERADGKKKAREESDPCVIVMEGMDKLPDFELLEDINVLMETREKGKGVWLSLSDQSRASSFASGKYRVKRVSHFIATKLISSKSVNLSSAIIDAYAHIRLSDTQEPTAGKILRTLLCQMMHVRKGRFFSKNDSLYQVIVWTWQFWVLYNHYMDKFDLQLLKIGTKNFLSCPVKLNSADGIYNWFVELWNFHLVPKIRESILDPSFKLKSKKTSRSETVRVLMLFLTQRVMQLTCPLYPQGTFDLIKNLYGVAELQNLTYPLPSDKNDSSQQTTSSSMSSGTKSMSPKLMTKFKSSTSTKPSLGSPKSFYRSVGNLSEELNTTPPSNKKLAAPQFKQSGRPKSGGLFGRSSTLRKSLFKGSSRSSLLYAVEEEDKNRRKSQKSSKKNSIAVVTKTDEETYAEQQQQQDDMEDLLNKLMSSTSSSMNEQRAEMSSFNSTPSKSSSSPSHHKISVSPSESSRESIETTSPTTSNNDQSFQPPMLSDEDPAATRHYVNVDIGVRHQGQPRILSIQQEMKSLSRSEDNVFTLSNNSRRSSLEDILRPASEVSLTSSGHHREMSNSSDLLSDSHSSFESNSVSYSFHESVPSFGGGNQNMLGEHFEEEEDESNYEEAAGNAMDNSSGSSSVMSSLCSDVLIRKNSPSMSFYSATLGVTPIRKISTPVRNSQEGVFSSSRRLSSPPTMTIWEEESVVEM